MTQVTLTPSADAPDGGAADGGTAPATGNGRQSYEASQWRLVWRAFKKHRLAMVGLAIVGLFYFVAVFAEFLAPFSNERLDADYAYAPPQQVHFVDDGKLGLYVYGYSLEQDPDTLALTFTDDESQKVALTFFAKGEPYKLFGVIPWDRHLIGPADSGQPMYLLGADNNGYDLLSRMIHGTRISMSIGLIGVLLAFILGIVLGGISGYVGGRTDTAIQRSVEIVSSIPTLPMWLTLSAALPLAWGPLQRYFAILMILAIIGWTDMCRTVRGKFLALRQDDFVTSAHLDGNSQARVIYRHMLPSFSSHIIAALTLSIPGMILGETALSFLGLGLQPPTVSWGVLLQEAQNIRVVSSAPWILLPGVLVVISVLALNFAGDGLRDAADPYRS